MATIVKNNLQDKYNKGTIVIHWLSLLLILGLIPSGFIMADTPVNETKVLLLRMHVIVGFIVFLATLLRVYFFFSKKRPTKIDTGSTFHNKLIVLIENSFYIVLLLICISGIAGVLMAGLGGVIQSGDYKLFPTSMEVPPFVVHKIGAIGLIILLLAHIGGVINHYINFKENTIKRIIP